MAALWERSAALAGLDDLQRATARSGLIALVAGEAGIGKTSLVRAFAEGCGNRVRVLWGLCDPLLTPRASGPLQDVARQAGGLLLERLEAGADQADMFAALVAELSGPRPKVPRVVVIEDAQWADEATHDLLVFLGRRVDRLRALLVVTYRDDEIGVDHPLRTTLAALPRTVTRPVPVTPLSRECVAEQAARAGREPDGLYQRSGGNPLLLTELLAAADDGVPPTVRDLILARLRTLPAAARDIAHLIAVMPSGADAPLLAGSVDAVEQGIAAGVLVARTDRVSFRHELLRHAVEDSLSPARRIALHRRALSLLEAMVGVDPARLVHHARHAGDATALLRHGLRAASGAARQGAHREAVAHYRLIRPYAGALAADERASMLERYAVEAYLTSAAPEGLEALRAAQREREDLGEPVRVGENYRWISRLAWWSGRGAEAAAAGRRAVEVLEPVGPSRELAMAYSNRSQLHMLSHEMEDAIEWGERAKDMAERLGDIDTAVHAAVNASCARLTRGDPAGPAALRAAHVTASASGLADHAARALACLASCYDQMERYDLAWPVVEEVLRYSNAHDLVGYVHYLSGVRAAVRLERLEWDAALADVDAALAGTIGITAVTALVVRGRILAARGDPDALPTLDVAAGLADGSGDVQRIGPVAVARAEYFVLTGDPDRAAVEARRGLELATAKQHWWYMDRLAYLLGQATGEAVSTTDHTPYGRLLAGEWAAAAAAWSDVGAHYTRLNALAQGDDAAVTEALHTLASVGADVVARRLRDELRRSGVQRVPRGPRRSTVANVAGLTARQVEIVRLLAEGLSNADIAARLTLSHRTVEHHISAVLGKFDVTSRGQAVAAARRLGLT